MHWRAHNSGTPGYLSAEGSPLPVDRWVDEMAATLRPARVVWCDGSDEESARLVEGMLEDGTLHRLHPEKAPRSHLHRSHPSDVARTEHLTFIASREAKDAGPINNWMSPEAARLRVWPLFGGAMEGRTLYVVPYVMGPPGSPFTRVGVEITDSPYVVANMRIMTRMGRAALKALDSGATWVPGFHSLGDLSPERRFIVHFPEERTIWSVGSGYGGNALLGKKCFALRIASRMARDEGWMAEHMLVLELELQVGLGTAPDRGPPQRAVHRRRAAVAEPVAPLGGPAGGPSVRDHLRGPPRAPGAARLPEPRLGPRRPRRRFHGLGDHRGRRREAGGRPARPDGDAAVLPCAGVCYSVRSGSG